MPVYLIHFTTPFKHAVHYLGYAANVKKRVARHRANNGAKLLMYLNNAGIEWHVVRIWWDGDKAFERKLKKHSSTRNCPVCNPKLKKFKSRGIY